MTAEERPGADDDGLADFLAVRPRLFGLAYRMLGVVAEAEDVVQEAWIRWQTTDRSVVVNPAAFLTTTTTRLAITAATSARARREQYVGPWLPEPVDTSADPALGAERAEALETGLLVLLERLTPVERAAYVLREAFGYPYAKVAEVLDLTEANARQLVHRAQQRIGTRTPAAADPAEHRRLLAEFVAAAQAGDLPRFEQYLAADVVARSDGGGRVHASRKDVVGRERVALFLARVQARYWAGADLRLVEANGLPALLVVLDGAPFSLVGLELSERGIERLDIQVNPDKLTRWAV
jgi:RNA polymerase sigma-70 factor (ECF subfamily)